MHCHQNEDWNKAFLLGATCKLNRIVWPNSEGGFSNSETEWLNQKAVSFSLLCSVDTGKFQPFRYSAHKTTGRQMTPGHSLQQGTTCSSVHSVVDGQSGHSDLKLVLTAVSKTRLEVPFFRTLSEKSTISRTQCYQCRTFWKLNSVSRSRKVTGWIHLSYTARSCLWKGNWYKIQNNSKLSVNEARY